jgi:4,4'-diaponeurosporenoate glycosyltransferase
VLTVAFGVFLALQQAVFWLFGLFLFWRIPHCRHRGEAPRSDRISVIIPARNEAHNLPSLLRSLAAQERAPEEIIVVDDGSDDGTAEVAARLGARVVAAEPMPGGWVGKTWACWTGARAARGDLLVFLDADTILTGGALAALASTQRADGGLVSVMPLQAIRRPYEALAAVLNIVVMAGVNAFSPLGRRLPPTGCFGACVVCRREEYFAAGGHGAVKGRIAEDFALGRKYRSLGIPVTCYGGRGTASVRMYPDGLRSLVEGFTKNMAIGSSDIRRDFKALIAGWISGATLCAIAFLASLTPALAVYRTMEIVFYAFYAVQMYWMLRRIGNAGPLAALLFPFPLAFFHLVYLRSVHSVRRRNCVTWKGRIISSSIGDGAGAE